MLMDVTAFIGIVPAFFLGGLEIPLILFPLSLFGAFWATSRAIKYTEGAATPVWLAFIWLVPCLGACLALFAISKQKPPSDGVS
jgi:hypothetical protein